MIDGSQGGHDWGEEGKELLTTMGCEVIITFVSRFRSQLTWLFWLRFVRVLLTCSSWLAYTLVTRLPRCPISRCARRFSWFYCSNPCSCVFCAGGRRKRRRTEPTNPEPARFVRRRQTVSGPGVQQFQQHAAQSRAATDRRERFFVVAPLRETAVGVAPPRGRRDRSAATTTTAATAIVQAARVAGGVERRQQR